MLFKNFCGNMCGWKSVLKYVKCCLKTENYCLETLTKHTLSICLSLSGWWQWRYHITFSLSRGNIVTFVFWVVIHMNINNLDARLSPYVCVFFFFHFHCSLNMNSAFRLMNNNMFNLCTRITLYMRHCVLFIYCSRNSQPEKNIKNESHGYIFKNYFTTVFSVFNQNNLLLFVKWNIIVAFLCWEMLALPRFGMHKVYFYFDLHYIPSLSLA